MTDSMKFGPEWLRNMSADLTSSNSVTTSGNITNPTSVFGSSSSGVGGDGTSVNNANNSSSSNTNTSSLHNNGNAPNSGTSRNTFPEFRYGREEMLLLFDRNCAIPEVLPSYKSLYVERVQLPLALVPSTDEEMMQASAPSAQRPGWLQRSPVGFSTALRGTGRVGCMERGRMRGKSIYHPVFQRPNAMFDEEQRPSAIKQPDRSWGERNGGSTADTTAYGSSTIGGGVGLGADAWNGNTPVSSPRREFSNHPRNMENWRRSRNEDGSGCDPATATTFSADGTWRMNSSGFQNSHARWSRSTSWRDDELANNENSGISVSSGCTTAGSGGVIMLRSDSSISTTHAERIGHSAIPSKQTGSPGLMRPTSVTSSGNRNSASGNIWPNTARVEPLSNMQGDGSINEEMALPEWATENPSDIGGTFDATGAFHGAVDDDEHADNVHQKHRETNLLEKTSIEEKIPSGKEIQEELSETADDLLTKSSKRTNTSLKETDNYQDSLPASPTAFANDTENNESTDLPEESDNPKHTIISTRNQVTPLSYVQIDQKSSEIHLDSEFPKEMTSSGISFQKHSGKEDRDDSNTANSNAGDYAERMMKVTDDMIEKLIMDDEDAKDDRMKSTILSAGSKMNTQNMYIALQQSPSLNHPPTISPSSGGGTGPAVSQKMSIYNMGGMMVDHTHNISALHQLQQQQLAAVAAVAIGLQPTPPPLHPITSSPPTDLWLYRDPQAKVQGPFSALEMTEWYRAGYFNENLFVRRVCDLRFRPLGELIKICNGQMPFSHSHLIPIDLNSTRLTPPLAPVITTQPSVQSTEFLIKTMNDHQQHQQHEKLKGNVTAAADSLSNTLKSLINSVDISQVLNMHFQTLQERFIRNQEIEIVNELSKNECFRHLSTTEQKDVVRQKMQALGLPEYLTSLTGLSNSLAALNPTAGTQLYDTIVECTKKEQLFSNQGQPQPQTPTLQQQQQQRINNHAPTSSTSYMNAEDFIIKAKNSSHDLNSNDLLNEFNLRMILNNGSDSGIGAAGVAIPSVHGQEFLSDQQLFGVGTNSAPNTTNKTSQSPMIQMWMNSLGTNQTNALPSPQHLLMSNLPQANDVNNQWLSSPLVGIPSINLSRDQHVSIGNMNSPKPTPASMWDVATLEQHVQVKQQQKEQQLQQQIQQQAFEHHRHLKDSENNFKNHTQQHQNVIEQTNKNEGISEELEHQKEANDLQKSLDAERKVSSSNYNKLEQQHQSQDQNQCNVNEKTHLNVNSTKRNCNNTNNSSKLSSKSKNESLVDHISKKTDEERRREQNEEKRRQKEERKRQQLEEEKRRLMQAEEEKRRQTQEEEKRQQQIQAQRRKALMNNTNNNISTNNNDNSTNPNTISPNSVTSTCNQKSKEQQRIQSSVAPWSTQTMATKSQGPGLAEIQKAERRERRADQQRQLEIQEKQLRALAASAESQDTVLKWNAAPVPVKSFAEIQAEEAKRLALEQMELQRRKEQEVHNNLVAFSSTGNTVAGALSCSTNIASIWSGNKIWGTSTNATGIWEDPLKFSKSLGTALCNTNNNSSNSSVNLTAASIVSLSSNLHQKSTLSQQQPQQQTSTTQSSSTKNIKKSQSVAVMQNALSPSTACASSGPSNQKKLVNSSGSAVKQAKQQKTDNHSGAMGSGNNENKKITNKNIYTANKSDDYEAEFTNWCTKSLNIMNTKVDVPTFVSFLRDLESPYEVKDYIRMYLGESKEYIDFSKQFLERRSKYKNLQRAQNAHDDDLCKPAQAITPSVNESSENKGKQKKVKKNKMTKLDARILGFSVTAAEGRINVGDRDYGDTP